MCLASPHHPPTPSSHPWVRVKGGQLSDPQACPAVWGWGWGPRLRWVELEAGPWKGGAGPPKVQGGLYPRTLPRRQVDGVGYGSEPNPQGSSEDLRSLVGGGSRGCGRWEGFCMDVGNSQSCSSGPGECGETRRGQSVTGARVLALLPDSESQTQRR